MCIFTFKNPRLLLISVLLSLNFSTAQSVEEEGNTVIEANFRTLENERFTISYPESWKADESGARGTALLLFVPSDPTVGGAFKDNINLLIQDLTGYELDLQGFTDLSLNQLKSMLPEVKMLSNERKKIGDYDVQQLIFTAKQKGYDLKFEQRYWVIGKEAYVLTATYLETNAAAQEPMIVNVLNTFTPIIPE
ncbi:hypothetical protein [Ascidiimonas sp. W6]|uniref:hypothetical protein n=1 Tax=Ascidiimonas meishanensis TaxID=3128903 RepID=UPI0030EEB17D